MGSHASRVVPCLGRYDALGMTQPQLRAFAVASNLAPPAAVPVVVDGVWKSLLPPAAVMPDPASGRPQTPAKLTTPAR